MFSLFKKTIQGLTKTRNRIKHFKENIIIAFIKLLNGNRTKHGGYIVHLSILMLAGIKNVLIIVNRGQLKQFKKILPNGENLGIKITFAEQKYPRGLPEAFIIGIIG